MKLIIIYMNSEKKKWLFSLFSIFYFSFLNAQAPNITRIEYYLDTDPGYGNATNLSFTGTNDVTGSININLTPLSQGVHIVGIRSRDANGAWSIDNKWIFLKPYANSGAAPQPNINRVEWYLDTDPGYGNATPITISAGQDLSGLAININLVPLSQGVHIAGIRSRDANGAWSLDNKWIFLKPYANSGASPQPNINRVEWYLDNDPGYGKATPITISAGQDLSGLAINISLTPLNQGVHIVGVRSQDANGAWSLDNKWIFLKPYTNSGAVPQPNITRVEWYLDNDPGYGKGTPITISAGQDLSGLAINISLTPLNQGVHIVGIRSQDANGAWSIDNKWIFLKPYTNSGAVPQPNITKVEYYIDDDPGYGKASNVTITAGPDLNAIIFTADITNLPNGTHKLGIRSLDANGAWSIDNQFDFTGGLAPPAITWIGRTSTDWNTAANWSYNKVPATTDNIVIPFGTPYAPIIANGITAFCKGILVKSGANVTILLGGVLKAGP